MGAADIAKAMPAPSKLKGYSGGEDGDEADGETEADEDKEPKVGAMQEFLSILGITADAAKAEEACDALERYLDIAGR